MILKSLAVLFLGASLSFCATSVVTSSNGNMATIHVTKDGNVSIMDSQGHLTNGTFRHGNLFLSGSNGITTGTIRHGNVFLTNPNGTITTGTIRNGNIFLSGPSGITTGSYTANTAYMMSSSTITTAHSDDDDVPLTQTPEYQANYQMGQAAGGVIVALIRKHSEHKKMKKFCETHHGLIYTDYWGNGHNCK